MKNLDTKKVITHLLMNNLIVGRITTDPCNYKKELQIQMSFDDIIVGDKNIAMLYDTEDDTRAELSGLFKLPLDLIEEAHFTDDILGYEELYGKYHILVYLGKELDKEVLITFNLKDSKMSPFVLDNDEALEYAYASEAMSKLDYFVSKPVKINMSAMSCFSTYDTDNCTYANPLVLSMELKSFQYTSEVIDCIPCIKISDKENESVKLVLNAVGCVREVNIGDSADKRIFHFETELGLVTVFDKGYVFPVKRVVA